MRILALMWAALALIVSGCTNNLSGVSTSGSNTTGIGLNGSTQIFSITNVIQDQTNPAGTIDVVGDGTGAMSTYCTAGSGDPNAGVDGIGGANSAGTIAGSGQTGTSNCGCTYAWSDPATGATGSVNVNTSYHESNMIECPYSVEFFPSDVTQVSVSIFLISNDTQPATNTINLNLGNGSGSGISLTSAANYVQVSRYQCRDIQSIPYLGGIAGGQLGTGNTIYDPILSEDPELTYPLDFYTTNLGGTYASYIQNSASLYDWNCPSNPNDPNYGNNTTLYSVGADSSGSVEIYPPAGSAFDRSTFYVSKTLAGVFTVPLNSYIAPTMVSATSNIGGPVGYGAAPIVTGTNQESCPVVSIPSGYHWVKVWLFRADLQDRRYATSPAVSQVGAIACNPSVDFPNSVADPVFPDCAGACATATCTETCTGSSAGCTLAGTGVLADRVLAGAGLPNNATPYPMCVDLNHPDTISGGSPNGGAGATTDAVTNAQYADYTAFGLGTDIWLPKALKVTSGSANLVDPLDLFGKKYGSGLNSSESVPKDEALTSIDLDLGQPRYDFVFVVTPTTAMAADMENSSNSSNYPYIPFRFPTAADCLSSNPNFPTGPGDCNPAKIIHYGLKLHDVSSNGDPPASDPNEAGVFPLCALQPN